MVKNRNEKENSAGTGKEKTFNKEEFRTHPNSP